MIKYIKLDHRLDAFYYKGGFIKVSDSVMKNNIIIHIDSLKKIIESYKENQAKD